MPVPVNVTASELVLESRAMVQGSATRPGRHCFIATVWMVFTCAGAALAEEIPLDGWTHQKFGLFGGNVWHQSPGQISVESDDSVSLLWRALPDGYQAAASASWTWSVEKEVPPTDLSQKGGDDRNLALYFTFAPPEVAERLGDLGIIGLLDRPDIRVLIYVWGGLHSRGDIVPSPYLGARGVTIGLRKSGAGQYDETVDLRSDLGRAFGQGDLSLIGLALSPAFEVNDAQTALQAAESGHGISPALSYMVRDKILTDKLVEVLAENRVPPPAGPHRLSGRTPAGF